MLDRGKLFMDSTFILKQSVNQSLNRKYQYTLEFYQANNINEILHGNLKQLIVLDFIDMRCLAEQNQYLKRAYYYKTPTGKIQIDHRLQICTQYYATYMPMTFAMPMIIITNTKNLFLRRNRRIKKIQAGEGSSDQTQKGGQQPIQNDFSENFLKSLSKSNLSQQISSFEQNQSYQSSFYLVYNERLSELIVSSQSEDSPVPFRFNRSEENNEEEKLHHLIIEINSHIRSKKSQLQTFETPLNSIHNQFKSSKPSSIVIEPIQNKLFIKKNSEKRSNVLSDYFGFVIQKPTRLPDLGFKYESPIFQDSSKLKEIQLQKQKQERARKRRKIRQKAQQLLKRVRNSQELY